MNTQQNNNWEKEFFDRLAEKLEELFPKTNINNPEILSEGNRTTALVFNAFANIIFKDIMEKALSSERQGIIKGIEERIIKDIKGNEIEAYSQHNLAIKEILTNIKEK